MKKPFYIIVIIILLFSEWVITSCSSGSEDLDIGQDLLQIESTVLLVDTFSVNLSTVKLDSIPTSNVDEAMVGKYYNKHTGSLEMLHYFNVNKASGVTNIRYDDETDIFDSLTVRMNYSHYYTGDTIQPFEMSLYRLTEELDYIDDGTLSDYIYNTNSFPYDSNTPLGSIKINVPKPVQKDTLEFRIDDTIGKEIIKMVTENSITLESNDNFREYMKGFVLKASSSNSSILGFTQDSIRLKLYTHRKGLIKKEKKYEFFPVISYNQAIADRSGTSFNSLSEQKTEISSNLTDTLSYIQGSSGIVTRIDFPTMGESFFEYMSLFKAQLILYIPEAMASGIENDKLPSTITLYATGANNNLITSSSITATLISNQEYNENAYYVADITDWLSSELIYDTYNTNDGLVITFPFSTLQKESDMVLFKGHDNKENTPKLNLFYLKYDNE